MAEPGSKYEGIQALRFVAALLVVVTHSTLYAGDRLDGSIEVWHFGEIGVPIFFTISGFVMLISSQRLIGTRDGWKRFGMRRIIRIVPMYWLATTVKLLILLALPGAALYSQFDAGHTVLSYLFLPGWSTEGKLEPLLGVGWTLVFEMFFYAVFALALFTRIKPLWLCAAVMAACTIGSLFRPDGEYLPVLYYLNPIVMYFLVGMVVAQWAIDRHVGRLLICLAGVVAVWTAVAIARNDGNALGALSTLATYTGVTLLLFVVVAFESRLRWIPKPIIFMGDASYTLYLVHPLVAPIVPVLLSAIGVRIGWVSVLGSIAAAICAAAVIYWLVERPLTRLLLRTMPYTGTRAVVAPPATPQVSPARE